MVWNLKIPTHSGRGWVVTAGLLTDVHGSPNSRLIEGQEVPIAISVILEYAAELVCISEPFDFEESRLAQVS